MAGAAMGMMAGEAAREADEVEEAVVGAGEEDGGRARASRRNLWSRASIGRRESVGRGISVRFCIRGRRGVGS